MTSFKKTQIYDRTIVAVVMSFVLLLAVLPEAGKFFAVICLCVSYFFTHIWCVIHELIPFLRRRLDSVERVYEGNFDHLLKEMYEAGLELKNQMGSRYIFATRYILFENERYLVEEGTFCTVRSSRISMSNLEKSIEFRERSDA